MNPWRPMTEHVFPWEHRDLIIAVFDAKSNEVDILLCICAEHGALFRVDGGMLSIHEEGWIPFAWRIADMPQRDDNKFPPLWTDYLTTAET